jgi:hypothetical protein
LVNPWGPVELNNAGGWIYTIFPAAPRRERLGQRSRYVEKGCIPGNCRSQGR